MDALFNAQKCLMGDKSSPIFAPLSDLDCQSATQPLHSFPVMSDVPNRKGCLCHGVFFGSPNGKKWPDFGLVSYHFSLGLDLIASLTFPFELLNERRRRHQRSDSRSSIKISRVERTFVAKFWKKDFLFETRKMGALKSWLSVQKILPIYPEQFSTSLLHWIDFVISPHETRICFCTNWMPRPKRNDDLLTANWKFLFQPWEEWQVCPVSYVERYELEHTRDPFNEMCFTQ